MANKWIEFVRSYMNENNISYHCALCEIKKNNLYTPVTKKKQSAPKYPHDMFKGTEKRIAKTPAEHTMLGKMGFTHAKPKPAPKKQSTPKPTMNKGNTDEYEEYIRKMMKNYSETAERCKSKSDPLYVKENKRQLKKLQEDRKKLFQMVEEGKISGGREFREKINMLDTRIYHFEEMIYRCNENEMAYNSMKKKYKDM